jgi:hypothetical protein
LIELYAGCFDCRWGKCRGGGEDEETCNSEHLCFDCRIFGTGKAIVEKLSEGVRTIQPRTNGHLCTS